MVLSAASCRNSLETYMGEKKSQEIQVCERKRKKDVVVLRGCVGANGSWELDMCLSEKREYWASSKQEAI